MIEELKNIDFQIYTTEVLFAIPSNIEIIYKKISNYDDAYIYARIDDLKKFFIVDKKYLGFFTIPIHSTKQVEDLLKSLDYKNYL